MIQKDSLPQSLEILLLSLWISISLALAILLRNLIVISKPVAFYSAFDASLWVLFPSLLIFLAFRLPTLEQISTYRFDKKLQLHLFRFLLHGLIISGIAFLVKEKTFSRLVLFGFLLFSHSGIVLASIFRQRLRQNRLESNSLVILHEGQSFVKPFARSLASSQPEIIEFASFLQTKNWQSLLVDTLVFFLKTDSFQKYRHVIEHKISQGIRCELFLDEISDLNGSVPVAIHFAETSLSPLYQSTKRLIDLLLCLPGIALYCFLHLIFGPIIRYQTGGCSPLFYQERLGKNGKPFQLVKFRTMSAAPLPSDAVNEVSGPAFKIKNDPRIIPIGRFLRRTSLDEVPQFLNVLKGDMSVVGPRPPLTGEVADYEAPIYKRLRVQPGITGYWQVTSRKSTTSFDQIFQDDLYYLSHASLFLDLYIIVMTPIVMLRGEGR